MSLSARLFPRWLCEVPLAQRAACSQHSSCHCSRCPSAPRPAEAQPLSGSLIQTHCLFFLFLALCTNLRIYSCSIDPSLNSQQQGDGFFPAHTREDGLAAVLWCFLSRFLPRFCWEKQGTGLAPALPPGSAPSCAVPQHCRVRISVHVAAPCSLHPGRADPDANQTAAGAHHRLGQDPKSPSSGPRVAAKLHTAALCFLSQAGRLCRSQLPHFVFSFAASLAQSPRPPRAVGCVGSEAH